MQVALGLTLLAAPTGNGGGPWWAYALGVAAFVVVALWQVHTKRRKQD